MKVEGSEKIKKLVGRERRRGKKSCCCMELVSGGVNDVVEERKKGRSDCDNDELISLFTCFYSCLFQS